MLQYRDIILPHTPKRRRLITDNGELSEAADTASAGELSYVLIAKVIVEQAWRLDDALRDQLKLMLDQA